MGRSRLSDNRSRAVLVLGSHRSGTSAVTASLPLLGVDIGSTTEHILPPLDSPESNAKGFFELREIVNQHDRIFAAMGMSYDSAADFPVNWREVPEVKSVVESMANFVKRRFGDAPLWGFKDPRTCRFISVWDSIMDSADVDDRYIIVVRNPLDVAKSLHRRNHLPLERGLLIWLNHMVPAVTGTADKPRVIVNYDTFLVDPESELRKITHILGLDWPNDPMPMARFCQEFVEPGMRHYQSPGPDSANGSSSLFNAFNGLLRASRGEITSDQLTKLFSELESSPNTLMMPYLRQLENPSLDSGAETSGPEALCQVFFSPDGTNFNETMSERIILQSSYNQLHDCEVKLIVRGHFTAFRVDPLSAPGIIADFDVSVAVEGSSGYTPLPFNDVRHSGVISDAQGSWIALGHDPQYYFDNILLKPSDVLRIRFRYRLIEEADLVNVIQAAYSKVNESPDTSTAVQATDEAQRDDVTNGIENSPRDQLSRLKQIFYEAQSKDSELQEQLRIENTGLLETVSRLTVEIRQADKRWSKEIAQLTVTNEGLKKDLQQLREKNASLSSQSSNELKDLQNGLAHLEKELARIRSSKAYQFILRFRQRLDRLAPEGSRRRRLYMRAIHKGTVSASENSTSVQAMPTDDVLHDPVLNRTIFDMPLNNGRIPVPQIKLTNACSVRAVIPVYHPDQDFEQTLDLLRRQQEVHVDIMVIDSGRSQSVETLVGRFGARYLGIDKEDFKHGATRNLGIDDTLNSAYHLFTVQDAILSDQEVLARMVDFIETHKSQKIVACSGRTVPRSDADLFACWQVFSHYQSLGLLTTQCIEPTTIPLQKRLFYDNVIGLISSQAIAGYRFSNALTYGEDVDLANRLVAGGGALGYVREAVAIHSHLRTPEYYFRRGVLEGQTSSKYFGGALNGLTLAEWSLWVSSQTETWSWLKQFSQAFVPSSRGERLGQPRQIQIELASLRQSIETFASRWHIGVDSVDTAMEKATSSYVGSILGLLASQDPEIEKSVAVLTKGV